MIYDDKKIYNYLRNNQVKKLLRIERESHTLTGPLVTISTRLNSISPQFPNELGAVPGAVIHTSPAALLPVMPVGAASQDGRSDGIDGKVTTGQYEYIHCPFIVQCAFIVHSSSIHDIDFSEMTNDLYRLYGGVSVRHSKGTTASANSLQVQIPLQVQLLTQTNVEAQ